MSWPTTTVKGVDLHHCRAEELLPTLATGSVSLAWLDPPYFKVVADRWDHQWKTMTDYLDWLDDVLFEVQRVLAPNGSVYLWCWPRHAWQVEGALREHFAVINRIRWEKPGGGIVKKLDPEIQRRYQHLGETCLFAEQKGADSMAKGEGTYHAALDEARGSIFEPLRAYLLSEHTKAQVPASVVAEYLGVSSTMVRQHYFSASQWDLPTAEVYVKMREIYRRTCPDALPREYEALKAEYEALKAEYEALRRPFRVDKFSERSSLWEYAPRLGGDRLHPCEKPIGMCRDVIETSSRPGDLLLDLFAGSAMFGAAAIQAGRRAVMCEADVVWWERGGQELAEHDTSALKSRKMAQLDGPLMDLMR